MKKLLTIAIILTSFSAGAQRDTVAVWYVTMNPFKTQPELYAEKGFAVRENKQVVQLLYSNKKPIPKDVIIWDYKLIK